MKKLAFFTVLLFVVISVFGQQKNETDLIASSQTSASDIFFKPTTNVEIVVPGNYNNPSEISIRKGLPYFFYKAKSGENLKIAYIGGSITRADNQYRTQSLEFIQGMFPKIEIKGINAGVSGTDADLGAARLYDHVLKHKPDLIFIEFAVNGGFPEGIEGMVRQIIKYNNAIDICFIYTVTSSQLSYYHGGIMTPVMKQLEDIAIHYNISSVHLGMEVADLVKKGMLLDRERKSENEDKPFFSSDGVHPSKTGGDLYASAIARSMLKMQNKSVLSPYQLPEPLYTNNWEDATMIEPLKAMFTEGWTKLDLGVDSSLKAYENWFPYVMVSERPEEECKFKFKGKAFGLFDIGGPEVGLLDIYVDGKQVKLKTVKPEKRYKIEEGGEESYNVFLVLPFST